MGQEEAGTKKNCRVFAHMTDNTEQYNMTVLSLKNQTRKDSMMPNLLLVQYDNIHKIPKILCHQLTRSLEYLALHLPVLSVLHHLHPKCTSHQILQRHSTTIAFTNEGYNITCISKQKITECLRRFQGKSPNKNELTK